MSRQLTSISRFCQRLLIACLWATTLFFYASPALAIGSTPSRADEGTAPLNNIYREAEKAVQPENALDGDNMIKRANQGLNEVQKDADVNQMNRPDNSGQATSIIDQIQDTLSQVAQDLTK
ncbi:MAG: hypothetical protein HC929_12705 [Leptolyngbyaceae cyanobacterium SM2_5_2]|nr:hypothetical protein [Leptolyngbyaceae cyanobacterium SM2_5_2]